ncbi:hypothetical protein ABXV18_24535 [Vibrio owensii]|uniref:hypothetical protein n=1 Tax=Vibrio owensii TaxID=696485 RepID=UPI003398D091
MAKAIVEFLPLISEGVIKKQVAKGKLVEVDDEYEKVCTKCDDSWPLTSEFFYECKKSPLKTHCWCKGCYQSERYAKRRDKKAAANE